jgi:hypothetical protein
LLRGLDVQLPEYDDVRTESSDLSDLQPTEYRADLVLFLLRGAQKVLGVIVEVQLARDDDKRYAWPAYVANLRARHRCPTCLLVVTVEEAVARWARRAIELGPGSRCTPWVIGPSNAPAVTELRHAEENVELAVLSAIEHGHSPDTALAGRIASAAIVATAGIDYERSSLYSELILTSLSEIARGAMLEAMTTRRNPYMSPLGFEYQSDFVRQRIDEREKARLEGCVEIVLKLLVLRFGSLAEAVQTRIRSASEEELDAVVGRILAAPTLEEALGVPS